VIKGIKTFVVFPPPTTTKATTTYRQLFESIKFPCKRYWQKFSLYKFGRCCCSTTVVWQKLFTNNQFKYFFPLQSVSAENAHFYINSKRKYDVPSTSQKSSLSLKKFFCLSQRWQYLTWRYMKFSDLPAFYL